MFNLFKLLPHCLLVLHPLYFHRVHLQLGCFTIRPTRHDETPSTHNAISYSIKRIGQKLAYERFFGC